MFSFKEQRLIKKFNSQEFYTTREFPAPIKSVREDPTSVIGMTADIGHRFFKVTSDLLRIPQGESRQELNSLSDGSFIPRTREATVGAVSNVLGGVGNVFQGKFIAGPTRVVGGVVDAFDIIPSAIADVATTTTNVQYRTRNAASKALAT